jgi:hypothetical protein
MFFSDMKTLELVMALGVVPFLSYAFILPESPRWLISKGRIDAARVILTKALKMRSTSYYRTNGYRTKYYRCFYYRSVILSIGIIIEFHDGAGVQGAAAP